MRTLARLRSHWLGFTSLASLLIALLSLLSLFGPSLAQTGAVIEFSAFGFDKQQFTDGARAFRDRLDLRGAFTLGAGADGIDPVAEGLKVTLTGAGGCLAFSQIIPPGAFRNIRDGFRFRGSAAGELSRISIQPQGTGQFSLKIRGARLQFACPLATTIAFIIGDDGGAFDFDTDTQIPLNTPPVADAGPDQTVPVGETVTLDGSGTSDVNGDALTFTWSLASLPAGSTAALSDPSAIMPTFVADVAGSYVAQLIVNDGQADSAPDTVTITTENSAPVANAGLDQTVAVGATVQLDGGASSDADGDALTFTWSLAVPEGSTAALSDPSVVNPSFVADGPGTYTAQLIVNDGQADSAPDEVVITTENSQPVANAGPDQTALVGDTVTLDGNGSSDADGDPLTFQWSLIAKPDGSTAVLATADQVQSSFVPDLAGDYLAQLIVNDGQLDSDPDTALVKIEVTAPTEPVISDFNPKSATIGDQVTITGTNLLPDSGGAPQVTLPKQGGGTIDAPIVSFSDTSIVFIIPAGAATGALTVTIDGQSVPIGGPDPSGTVTVNPSSTFSLSVEPAVANVLQGESVSFDIELESTSGFTQLAALSAEGLPSGVTGEFSPATLTAGQRGTLTLTATSTAAIGSVSATVVATAASDAGPITQSDAFTLTVQQGGRTALLGRFMLVDGTPLQGVKLSLPCAPTPCLTETDSGGNFQFVDMPAGTLTMSVDSTPVGPTFPIYGIDVTLTEGQATQLPPLEITPQPPAERFEPIQNASADQVITDPRFPGASFTLPAGVTITGWDGALKTQMAIERLSPDMLPVPPPPGPTNSVYQPFFGTPMGGLPSAPIPVTAPNDLNLLPGEEAEIWYYDAAPFAGVPGVWRMAGMGTVSADGSTIVSNPGVGIERFCGVCGLFCIIAQQEGKPNNTDGPRPGDPVNVAIGQMITEKTDLVLPGRIPAIVHRTHNPFDPFGGIAGFELSLGPGWALSVEVVLQEETTTLRRLILPGNARFAFPQKPGETSYVNTTHPRFAGAVLTAEAGGRHTLRFKDGTLWRFAPSARVVGIGLLAEQVDRNGNRLTIERDSNNKITRIIEPSGRELVFTIASGRITQVTDPLGRTVKYGYDGARRLETVTDPAGGVTRYAYDSSGRILTITDPKGIAFLTNEYSPVSGRILKQTQADGGVWSFRYLVFPNVECPTGTICDPALVEESSETVGGLTGPLANVAINTTVVDPQANETTYGGLGSDGFEDQITDALGQTTSFERDPQGQVTAVTDPLGRITRFEYDTTGNVVKITDPKGTVRLFEYEPAFNRLSKLTDPLGNVTTFEYDAKANLVAVTDPEQNLKPAAQRLKTQIAYNGFGQPISTTDPLGNVTTFTYDSQGNLETIADPLGNTARRTYDVVSRLIGQTDPRARTTSFTYDDLNRNTQIVDALGGTTAFGYDGNGNLLTVADAKAQTTAYVYDSMDRLDTRTDPLGAAESFGYDAAGNLIRHTDRKGQVNTFSYDALDRRIGASYADGANTSFVYDAVGRLVQADDSAGGMILNEYDTLDRLAVQTTALGRIDYAYDDLGRRTQLDVLGQAPVTYGYDANSRLIDLVQGTQAVDFAYDALGRRTLLTLPNGVSTAYNYDPASRLTELIYRNATAELGRLTYQYDSAGNRNAVGGSFARTLLPDPVATATYDAANRQRRFGDKTMSFDPNGNVTSITDPSSATSFTWDARNRLVGLAGPGTTASFTYDAFGRRASKQINGQLAEYLYDGLDISQENVDGTPVSYLRGLNIDEPLVRNGGEHYLADALGSAIALTDGAGNVRTEYTYEPFGKTTTTGAISGNQFQYTGRENDGTRLYDYRARYYAPELHRFVSEDPIGFAGRQLDFYAYVGNSPTLKRDPSGLFFPFHIAQQIAVDEFRQRRRPNEVDLFLAQERLQEIKRDFQRLELSLGAAALALAPLSVPVGAALSGLSTLSSINALMAGSSLSQAIADLAVEGVGFVGVGGSLIDLAYDVFGQLSLEQQATVLEIQRRHLDALIELFARGLDPFGALSTAISGRK